MSEENETGSRKEKIESKGAYAYDLHEAIRDVRRAFTTRDIEKIHLCLEALRDICAPEIREAITEEWNRIDKKHQTFLERIQNAKFEAKAGLSGWGKKPYGGGEIYYIPIDIHAPQQDKERIEENARNQILRKIWNEMLHARLRACIDCLDRHGELRKYREVDYGRI